MKTLRVFPRGYFPLILGLFAAYLAEAVRTGDASTMGWLLGMMAFNAFVWQEHLADVVNRAQ